MGDVVAVDGGADHRFPSIRSSDAPTAAVNARRPRRRAPRGRPRCCSPGEVIATCIGAGSSSARWRSTLPSIAHATGGVEFGLFPASTPISDGPGRERDGRARSPSPPSPRRAAAPGPRRHCRARPGPRNVDLQHPAGVGAWQTIPLPISTAMLGIVLRTGSATGPLPLREGRRARDHSPARLAIQAMMPSPAGLTARTTTSERSASSPDLDLLADFVGELLGMPDPESVKSITGVATRATARDCTRHVPRTCEADDQGGPQVSRGAARSDWLEEALLDETARRSPGRWRG